jgi:PAS domain S-box-containing protein
MGERVGIVVTFREITRHKQVEAALRLSEEKYRLLWATAGDAFVLFDSNNVILEANAALATIFGYPPAEVIGQNLAMLQPERLREGHRRGLERYLKTGSRKLDWRATEVPGLHRDGHEIPLEIAFNHLQMEGQDLFAGFIRDITERKQAEQSLAVFAAIVDSSHDAIVSKTLEGIITSWNRGAEMLFGYSASEAIGKPVLMIIPPERVDEEPQILARQADGERMDHFETVRIRKDGRRIDVSLTLSPIRDSQGESLVFPKLRATSRSASRPRPSVRTSWHASREHARKRKPPTAPKMSFWRRFLMSCAHHSMPFSVGPASSVTVA